jgi:hypothetical protein
VVAHKPGRERHKAPHRNRPSGAMGHSGGSFLALNEAGAQGILTW